MPSLRRYQWHQAPSGECVCPVIVLCLAEVQINKIPFHCNTVQQGWVDCRSWTKLG